MSSHSHDKPDTPGTIPVLFVLEDPHELTGNDEREHRVRASAGQNLLDVALNAGINLEHACGGVCACSTCHVYIDKGQDRLSESTEDEEDRVEEAPGLELNSRLACQCEIQKSEAEGQGGENGAIIVRVPAWNRNAVKEVPH